MMRSNNYCNTTSSDTATVQHYRYRAGPGCYYYISTRVLINTVRRAGSSVGISFWNWGKKGYFSTFSRRWGRENALRAAIARCGMWERPLDVPGAERGAVGAPRGRAGAESEKSRFSIPLHPILIELYKYKNKLK
jgi:hypothetical protein